MAAEDPFFQEPGLTGDGQAPPAPYSMSDSLPYGGGDDPFSMPQQPMDAMPAPSYQPRPTDPYSLEEAAEIMEMVQSKFEASIKERADREAAQAAEVKRRAEEDLDGFYDQRTDEVARRQARSREREEALLREVDASVEHSASNPWARVCDLVDLKAPVLPSSSSTSGRGAGGSRRGSVLDAGVEGEDAFRATEKMRSLIIQMKADTAHDNSGDDA